MTLSNIDLARARRNAAYCEEILDFIPDFMFLRLHPPSIGQIAEAIGVTHSEAQNHVRRLITEGRLKAVTSPPSIQVVS